MKAIILVVAAASTITGATLQPTVNPQAPAAISQPSLTRQSTLTVDVAHPTERIEVQQ